MGFGPTSDSWRSPEYLGDIKELIDAYERRVGGEVQQLDSESRDAAIELPADSAALKRAHFRASAFSRPQHSEPTAEAAGKKGSKKQTSPSSLPTAATPQVTARRSRRLAEAATAAVTGDKYLPFKHVTAWISMLLFGTSLA